MHKFGLVEENMSFPKKEMERGRYMCLFNALLMQYRYKKYAYEIIERKSISFSRFYYDVDKYLPKGFYEYLETDDKLETKQFVWNNFSEAISKYNKAC